MLVNEVLDRMRKQERQETDIKILLSEIFGSHLEAFSKFAATAKGFDTFFKLLKMILLLH